MGVDYAHINHLPPNKIGYDGINFAQESNHLHHHNSRQCNGNGEATNDTIDAPSTPAKRDMLLSFAHKLYSTDPQNTTLLPILHSLEKHHPNFLPILLLISCVYYSLGNFESSLYYNRLLLQKDPVYVEAMSNIGTTRRAQGAWKEAEDWWWRAIRLRPTYWDAMENLLGVLCNPAPIPNNLVSPTYEPPPTTPRYTEALKLCTFIENSIFPVNLPRPRQLPSTIPYTSAHRLQNVFYSKGNIFTSLKQPLQAMIEYQKAIECTLCLPPWAAENRSQNKRFKYPPEGITTRDLIVLAVVLGKVLSVSTMQPAVGREGEIEQETLRTIRELGLADQNGMLAYNDLVNIVHYGGMEFVQRLLDYGGGRVPIVLLAPTEVYKLINMIFPATGGRLPVLADTILTPTSTEQGEIHKNAIKQCTQTTSTVLLTLAKLIQDLVQNPNPVSASSQPLSFEGIPLSSSLLLPLYYLALGLLPSASTCNNLGILLAGMNTGVMNGIGMKSQTSTVLQQTLDGETIPIISNAPVSYSGQHMALLFYNEGLRLDGRHAHLWTNLGSLFKDMGELGRAVQMYKQAVTHNPTFDVALANLANAIKDTGNTADSIMFYRRAVAVNPDFAEAVCGLGNALGGVCYWNGRGGGGAISNKNGSIQWVVDDHGYQSRAKINPATGKTENEGYLGRILTLIEKQLIEGAAYGRGVIKFTATQDSWIRLVMDSIYGPGWSTRRTNDHLGVGLIPGAEKDWERRFKAFFSGTIDAQVNEGGFVIRLIERLMRRIQRRWYLNTYGNITQSNMEIGRIVVSPEWVGMYNRPSLPPSLPAVVVPTTLPFHLFTYPVSPRETRLISHRTGLRISHSTLTQPWLPSHVYPPPQPPVNGKINIGYISSDLGNHPLSHLMQSVFGMHDLDQFNVFVYATSPDDGSIYRQKIKSESQNFVDLSGVGTQGIVEQVLKDGIHVLINLSGYTKGARNEVFAARAAPVQMSYMGFAGTISAGWCDWFIVDPIVCPPSLTGGNVWRRTKQQLPADFEADLDPEALSEDFVYTEKLIYLPHSYFVTDHKQSWFTDNTPLDSNEVLIKSNGTPEMDWAIEEDHRWRLRQQLFPKLNDDVIILANWNQLYKIDPSIFAIWCLILRRVPKAILWLLRFPAPGEQHLKDTATKWAGPDVAGRIVFTDVTNKNEHIRRGRIPDLFLDTTECNAHTTCCDALAVGTPVLTWPKTFHKMASRVAASCVLATGHGETLIVNSKEEYIARAVQLCESLSYKYYAARDGALPGQLGYRPQKRGKGELIELRKKLFLGRETSPLFDTLRWTRNVEKGYREAWKRWVNGTEFEDSTEYSKNPSSSGNIWISDDEDGINYSRSRYFEE